MSIDVYLVMSWSRDTKMMMKCIEQGACDFLIKPATLKEIENIWLHVFRKRMLLKQRKIDNDLTIKGSLGAEDVGADAGDDDVPCAKLEADDVVTDIRHLKRARLHWTRQLHHQFFEAVNTLGPNSMS